MNNFLANVEKIFKTLKQFEKNLNLKNQIRTPKMSDLELIAIDLTAEYMSIDSERQLFRVLPKELSSRIERSVYNKRRRGLFYEKHRLQLSMAEYITGNETYYLVDMIRRNYAKTFDGFKTRILSKITSLTVIQLINRLLNRNINNLKISIA